MSRNRYYYFFLICLTILIGLFARSRYIPTIIYPYLGDFLYAILFYWIIGFLFPKYASLKVAIYSILVCYVIEFSQLLHFEWLQQLRSSRLGGLVLGHGFLWTDLLSYTLGGGAAFIVERMTYFVLNKRTMK